MMSLRVLIVEDEALLAMELEESVEEAGHVVVGWAVTSAQAMKLVDQSEIDLALVDFHLADGPKGDMVAEYLAEKSKAMVVFTTANASRIPEGMLGAVGVLSKPYSSASIFQLFSYIESRMGSPMSPVDPPGALVLSPSYQDQR